MPATTRSLAKAQMSKHISKLKGNKGNAPSKG
jgi:hypothetical protein